MKETAVIGKRLPAIDALGKTTGQMVYLQDMRLPGMLYGRVLRSPHAHARVRAVDVGRALRLPGVKAVLGGENAPRIPFGIILQDELPVAVDRVRYVGDEVAAVAAVSEEAAEEAIHCIRVEYEPLRAVFDLGEAAAPGAPQLHEAAPGNIAVQFKLERGDVDGAFRTADCVTEAEYATSIQHQGNLEPICCIGDYQNGRLTIWGPFQSPFLARQYLIAKPLGLSEGRVRLIQTTVGGAFGGKLDQRLYVVAGALAMRAGAPVRLENTFEEELNTTRPRMPARIRFKTGFRKDGTLLAKETDITADNGAYSSLSPPILTSMTMRTDSLYRTPAVRAQSRLVYTNNLPSGQMRGFGNPQATFAWESHLDTVADALGMDPVELRLKNATQSGETSVHGWRMASCGYSECLRQAARRIGWKEKRGPVGTGRGVGLAGTIHVTSNKPFATAISGYDWDGSNALVRINEDGTVSLFTGEVDLGEGVATTLAMVVAEELGIPHDRVLVYPVDTDISPYCLGTYASRTTFMGGLASRNAARDARDQLFVIAAELLQAVPGDLEAVDGAIRLKGEPGRRAALGEVVKAGFNRGQNAITGRGTFASKTDFEPKMKYGNQTMTYSFACHAAEVEVDLETGEVRVLKIAAVHDLGRVINRLGAEGQVEGGAIQSMGMALCEQLIQRDGRVLNPNFVDYRIPSSLDAPSLDVAFVETIDPYGPYGAKGMAETAINPTAAAIANAVFHATGVRIRSLPITAEKILAALAALQRSAVGGRRSEHWHKLHDPENPENRNAGNGGDLGKHTVYLTTLEYLLAHSPWSTELRVRECHAGRGMYGIAGDDPRRPLLECLYNPLDTDVGVLLHDAQRASQRALALWPTNPSRFGWYSGSAVLNAWRLGLADAGSHRLDLYELAPATRGILRALLATAGLQRSRLDLRILPEPEDESDFDGEAYIESNVSAWNSRDLVLLDPFAMWRQDHDQLRRNRYRRIVDLLIDRGQDSPLLILFWTWGRDFRIADGDLNGTNARVGNGYQELRDRLHQAGRHFIRVSWRWGLQFAMWVLVPDSHLNDLCVALQRQCNDVCDHLLRYGCRGRLASPNVQVIVD